MTSTDEEKRAANEATFREAKERIRAAQRELEPPLERVPFLCECDDVACREPILLTAPEYEHVRGDGAMFVIARGHSSEGEGVVVDEYEQYLIVRKTDGSGKVARALDPRGEDA